MAKLLLVLFLPLMAIGYISAIAYIALWCGWKHADKAVTDIQKRILKTTGDTHE